MNPPTDRERPACEACGEGEGYGLRCPACIAYRDVFFKGLTDRERPALSEAEMEAEFENRMELTQLKAGEALTEANVKAIGALFNDYEEEIRIGADSYDAGLRAGRDEAGGTTLAKLMAKVDVLSSRLRVEQVLNRFYSRSRQEPRHDRH